MTNMKNKTLAIFGVGTYILSILSSAENLEGSSVAPTALIAISGIATLVFIILATTRLWKEAKGLTIIYASSALSVFIFTILQVVTSPPNGSPVIILMNMAKVVKFVSFILVIVKLFRIKNTIQTI